ncbi:hypothetical protein D3C81_1814650 [compost metagenome]
MFDFRPVGVGAARVLDAVGVGRRISRGLFDDVQLAFQRQDVFVAVLMQAMAIGFGAGREHQFVTFVGTQVRVP